MIITIFFICVAIAVFWFKPRTKMIIGRINIVVSVIGLILSLIISNILSGINSYIYGLGSVGSLIGYFEPSYMTDAGTGLIVFSVLWILWSVGLYISTKKMYPNAENEEVIQENYNEPTQEVIQTNYVNSNIESSFISGTEYGNDIKKIYELLKIKAISEEEAVERKNAKLDELVRLNISDNIEDFIIQVNRSVEDLLNDEEKKKIFDICKIKKEIKYKKEEELLSMASSNDRCDELTKEIILSELKRRGYNENSLEEIKKLGNVDNIYLVDRYEKTRYKYLFLKLEENGIDGNKIVQYKKALKLSTNEVIKRYFDDLDVLKLEYEKWVEENKVSTKAKKEINKIGENTNSFMKKTKAQSIILFEKCKENYMKNRMKWNSGIGAVVVIIVAIVGVKLYLGMKPSNSDIITYATKQVESQDVKPESMKVINASEQGKDAYVANISFKVKNQGYDTNYNDEVFYKYSGSEWHPAGVENISNNQIPTASLNEKDAINLLTQQGIGGVSITSNGLTLTNSNVNLENGTQSYNMTYDFKGKGYSINFTAVANFKFANGQWGFNSFTDVNQKSNIQPLNKNDMISLFVTYENGQNTFGENNIVANQCSIVNSNVDVATQSASATIAVATSGGQDSGTQSVQNYNVSYTFNINSASSASWQVENAGTTGSSTTNAVAPSVQLLENLANGATIGGQNGTEAFTGNVTVSNIKFDSSSQTATATVSGQYESNSFTDGSDSPQTGSFTGTFAFTNGQWQLTRINS